MSVGCFTDRDLCPSEAEISSALGGAGTRYAEMLTETRAIPKVVEDFRFMYGKKYGWAARFRLRGKLLVSYYPNEGYFVAQVILSPKQLAAVEGLDLHDAARTALAEATLYAEGKWLFVPVRTAEDEADVRRLIEVKRGMG